MSYFKLFTRVFLATAVLGAVFVFGVAVYSNGPLLTAPLLGFFGGMLVGGPIALLTVAFKFSWRVAR